jgi:hypothetical protein
MLRDEIFIDLDSDEEFYVDASPAAASLGSGEVSRSIVWLLG